MNSVYKNPLIERYASREMAHVFSPDKKFSTWRKLWIALAEGEKELGLNIKDEQIEEMKKNVDSIDYERAAYHEKDKRHDVMAHVHTFGEQCPISMPIIHLGATSCFVGDNTDLIVMREAMEIIEVKIASLLNQLAKFALKYKDLPTLGYTHFQPAQLTTVGKRATLWMNEFLMDIEDCSHFRKNLKMRGAKGTTGTQASYLNLFDGNHELVKELDEIIAEKFNFAGTIPVTGQTYSRKIDYKAIAILNGIAQSASKMTNDIRLLQNLKEIEEPFEKNQIGSSAMAYKRNPMRSERVSSLAKYVMSLSNSAAMVSATQWFERTLDDSANRRLSIPEAFMGTDASDILIEEGEITDAGIPVIILRDSTYVVNIGVAKDDLKNINLGDSVDVNIDETYVGGIISEINELPDIGTGLYLVKVQIEDGDYIIGKECEATFNIDERKGVKVPLSAIGTEDYDYVFLEKDNRSLKHKVEIIGIYKDFILINGIDENEKIVIEGMRALDDGDYIRNLE